MAKLHFLRINAEHVYIGRQRKSRLIKMIRQETKIAIIMYLTKEESQIPKSATLLADHTKQVITLVLHVMCSRIASLRQSDLNSHINNDNDTNKSFSIICSFMQAGRRIITSVDRKVCAGRAAGHGDSNLRYDFTETYTVRWAIVLRSICVQCSAVHVGTEIVTSRTTSSVGHACRRAPNGRVCMERRRNPITTCSSSPTAIAPRPIPVLRCRDRLSRAESEAVGRRGLKK